MISTSHRVPRKSIPYVLRKGAESTSKLFIIRYKKNEQGFSRYRVIISKKIDAKAVKRNKLRRQVYESIRTNIPKKEEISYDYILIPKKKIINATYQNIQSDISKHILNGHK